MEGGMGSVSNSVLTSGKDAKEYARFCRIHELFLVDGLEPWRTTLKSRGLSEVEMSVKVSAATDYIRLIGGLTSEPHGT